MYAPTISKKDVIIRDLAKEEIIAIYTAHSIRHFPENERKPVSSIERMANEGIYVGYGLYLNGKPEELLGYAFFTVLPDKKAILLDYFAVMEDYRNHGIGSLFLQYMKSSPNRYKGFLIESEDPDYAKDALELSTRRKRLSFYDRNGAIFTGIKATVFGVPYRLLFFPLRAKDIPPVSTLSSNFCNIYRRMVSPQNYETQVHIYLPKD